MYTNAGVFYPTVLLVSYWLLPDLWPVHNCNQPGYSVDWFKVAGGGGTSTGDVYTVSGTFGQPDAGGPMGGGGFTVVGGFWSLFAVQTASLTGNGPTITTQPQSMIFTNGAAASFAVSVSGTPPFFYQWQENGVNLTDGGNLSGSTTSNLDFSTTSSNDAGSNNNYTVIIENAYGSVTSRVATLVAFAPAITTQPQNLIISNGTSVTFSAPTSGTGPLYYQWQFDGTNLGDGGDISGSTTSSLTLSAAAASNGGSYTLVVTSSWGSVTSSVAKLTLILPAYYVKDLGSLGGSYTYAYGVNNSGQVVGESGTLSGSGHAFLYGGGMMTDLGTLGGSFSSAAQAINNSGQVVGYCYGLFEGYYAFNSFSYSGGVMSDLDLNDYNNVAYGVNDSGQIVGYCAWFNCFFGCTYLGDIPYLANDSGDNGFTDLGNLGSMNFSSAYGINNSGQVVGESETASGVLHAFLYSGGAMSDLGTLGGNSSYAYGINNNGQVVGTAATAGNAGQQHAFLYSAGAMTDLGTLPGGSYSGAYGINNGGQVVGSGDTASGDQHAFLYSSGAMFDLNHLVNTNTVGTYFNMARGINDSGQIIGNGANGHAYILTPSLPTSVPDRELPASIPDNNQDRRQL